MVQTRRQSLAASLPRAANGLSSHHSDGKSATQIGTSWAESHGTGRKSGVWGLSGSVAEAVSLAGTLALMTVTPAFAIYMCGPTPTRLPHTIVGSGRLAAMLFEHHAAKGGVRLKRAVSHRRCVIFTKLDGSLMAFYRFVQLEGLSGLWAAWPRPSLEAWSYVAGHGLLQAALQLWLPGRRHLGPVTPKGNVPVYKV